MDCQRKKAQTTVTGSREKTIMYGVLSLDGKQLFRQYEGFDGQSFIVYMEEVRKKSINFLYLWTGRRNSTQINDGKRVSAKKYGRDKD